MGYGSSSSSEDYGETVIKVVFAVLPSVFLGLFSLMTGCACVVFTVFHCIADGHVKKARHSDMGQKLSAKKYVKETKGDACSIALTIISALGVILMIASPICLIFVAISYIVLLLGFIYMLIGHIVYYSGSKPAFPTTHGKKGKKAKKLHEKLWGTYVGISCARSWCLLMLFYWFILSGAMLYLFILGGSLGSVYAQTETLKSALWTEGSIFSVYACSFLIMVLLFSCVFARRSMGRSKYLMKRLRKVAKTESGQGGSSVHVVGHVQTAAGAMGSGHGHHGHGGMGVGVTSDFGVPAPGLPVGVGMGGVPVGGAVVSGYNPVPVSPVGGFAPAPGPGVPVVGGFAPAPVVGFGQPVGGGLQPAYAGTQPMQGKGGASAPGFGDMPNY